MTALFKAKRAIKEVINSSHDSAEDPLTRALLPAPDESEDERLRRLDKMQAAQKVSREIDAEILESKKIMERKNKAIKVLLLGQAESGKSSVLKNFQLAMAPNLFRSEAKAWRIVIHLNLIASIKIILDVLHGEWQIAATRPTVLTDHHRRISIGLSPLLTIANSVNQKLDAYNPEQFREVCVRAGSGWKSLFGISSNSSPKKQPTRGHNEEFDKVSSVLSICRDDIIALWEDAVVKGVLKKHNILLEESPGFFLNDITRIATADYEPTDTDIVRARLRTMGVDEHRFMSGSRSSSPGNEWCIYDVGGSRSMRAHWIPFFDNVEAIIFLAPLSFHLVLDEDPRVNRVEDSIGLWREICRSPLLADASLILFFNKMDILRRNIAAGMRVRKYVPTYGDHPNDAEHVTKYFKDKFRAYHALLSPKPRAFICHELSAIDTQSTGTLLSGVREGILYRQLSRIQMI